MAPHADSPARCHIPLPGAEQVPSLSLKPQFETPTGTTRHENQWYQAFDPAYTVNDVPLHTARPIKLLVIGAGASGLNIAFKASRQFSSSANLSFVIYEKNTDVGGTWLENRYPGCQCDIPSHAYQWSFQRKHDWSSYYSGSEEIWRYLKEWAVESGVHQKVNIGHTVDEARWDKLRAKWVVVGHRANGEPWSDEGDVLAGCHGILNAWKYPDIPGLDSFQGKLMHSGNFDNDFDLSDKKVAVIGGGSSAVQIIPAIQPTVGKLYPFLRSPVWITAGFGAKYAAPGGVNFEYSDEQKSSFLKDPTLLETYGYDVEGELNKRFTLMHLHSTDQKSSREYVANDMSRKLGNDPKLTSTLVPTFALGCRRMTPGSSYLESLRKPNVSVITSSAATITPTGITDAEGVHTEVDVIICATGFDVSRPSYNIIGLNNRNLGVEWAQSVDGPKNSYLSIMAEGFPNLFYFIGPHGPVSHGSLLPIIEWHTRYMFKCISHMQRTWIRTVQPKKQAVADAYIHTHQLLKRTAWSSACSSWFKHGGRQHGPVQAIWPGSRLHYFEVLREPRFEDFDIEYNNNNRFAYFGNGYTETELREDGNAVWYLDMLKEELKQGEKAFWELV